MAHAQRAPAFLFFARLLNRLRYKFCNVINQLIQFIHKLTPLTVKVIIATNT